MTQLGAAAPTTTQAAAVVASSTTTNTSHSCHVLRRSLFISPSAHAADASETTTSDTAAADKEAFLKRWRSVAPSTQVEPGFPVPDEEVAVAADTIPDTLSFSLYLPHKIVFDKMKVESVLVPGTEGDFGVKPGHVPTIAQLRYATLALSLSLSHVDITYTPSGHFFFEEKKPLLVYMCVCLMYAYEFSLSET